MARVLLVWELGAGLGHLVNLLPLASGLRERGHEVFAAVRDVSGAERVFGPAGAQILQAPLRLTVSAPSIRPTITFAHLLHNNGFGSANELRALGAAWRLLFDFIRPDLIIFDHSPTALLAGRTVNAKRALIGTGFFCPHDEYPLRELRDRTRALEMKYQLDEEAVLQNVNRVLNSWNAPPIERLSQLYHEVDEHFLVSFQELDHYGPRKDQRYWGAWPNVRGKRPDWPSGNGMRIYAYLKPFAALPNLLALLADTRCPTLVYVDGISRDLQHRFSAVNIRFESERLNLEEVGQQCDLAIMNGNHGTTVSMLLAGKPTLQIPLFLEQSLFSRAVARLGAALVASPKRPEQVAVSLVAMLASKRFLHAAERFASRYSEFDPAKAISDLLERADQLAQSSRTYD